MTSFFRSMSIGLVSLAALTACSGAGAQTVPASGAKPKPKLAKLGNPPTSVLPLLYGRLLTLPNVQTELKLTDDQEVQVKKATDKYQAAMRTISAEVQSVSPDKPEERQAKIEEATRKMEAEGVETKKAVEGILLPKQVARLKGIALQLAGISALTDKEVQQDLNLSEGQSTAIKTATDDLMEKARALFSEGADFQALRPKMEVLRTNYEKQMTDILTDAQKASLETIKGEKFELTPPVGGGPGASSKAAPK